MPRELQSCVSSDNTAVSQGTIFQQEQIARAAALNLGVQSPDQIEFVTADPESADFARKSPKSYSSSDNSQLSRRRNTFDLQSKCTQNSKLIT